MAVGKPLTLKLKIGFTYKFIRVNPKKTDLDRLKWLVETYKPYCGYNVSPTGGDKTILKGFIVFPVRVPMQYLMTKLPNFLVGFVKDFNRVENTFHSFGTTIWHNEHPLKNIKTNLIDKFNNASTE